jgi:DNA polymerase-1
LDITRKTLYLIDGSALMYRAYFAFIRNRLINSRGEDTSATFGFVNTILKLVRTHLPDYLAVVFDTGRPTFRHELFPAYKATRQKMPDEMRDQIPRIRESVRALGLPLVETEGYEADDVIGTLAKAASGEGFEVFMVTGDKDFMQLVGPHISVLDPMKDIVYHPEDVQEKYGIPPERIVDYLALTGDASDNVPGIPKVGEKTARDLLRQFGSLDAVLDRCAEITKPSIRIGVDENRDRALLSRKLVTIDTAAPVTKNFESLRFEGFPAESTINFCREMEFPSLIEAVKGLAQVETAEVTVTTVTPETLDDSLRKLSAAKEIVLDLRTTSEEAMTADIVGMSLSVNGRILYFPFGHAGGTNLDRTAALPVLARFLGDPGIGKSTHDAKFNRIVLRRQGFEDVTFRFDTMLAAYVLDPGGRSYDIEILADVHLQRHMQSMAEVAGKGKGRKTFAEVDIDTAARFSGDRAETITALTAHFTPRMEDEGLIPLYAELEMPLVEVLADMEMNGVRLDTGILGEMSEDLGGSMAVLEDRIAEAAGERFNINSPKQLCHILFEKLKLKPVRKGKTGYSTDVDVLTKLAEKHDLPKLILEYRQLAKLKSTYVDALPQLINPETGRVHTSFNQAVTSTGRLSSSNPNLQNIPIRTELGRNIRRAFIAEPGYSILSADYSQIELRVMAHISQDPAFVRAFLDGEDIHASTAALLFGIFPTMLTPDHRRQAKIINFGVMYGMGPHSLSEQLGISFAEAKRYIDNYFATHPGVQAYIDRTIAEAEEKGFVTTLLGRRRYVTDIHNPNRNVAEFAKRTAINTPIQGSAADLIKKSMIELHRRLKAGKLSSYMILQVHDELVLEVKEEEREQVQALVKEVMESAMALSVPLAVEIGIGQHWLEAH